MAKTASKVGSETRRLNDVGDQACSCSIRFFVLTHAFCNNRSPMRTLYTIVAVTLTAYVVLCAVMYVFQRSLIYHPQPRAVSAVESTMKLAVEGAEVVVTVRPHDGLNAIVYFGGNGEDVSRNLGFYAEAFPEHALYLMHYRGYGGSTGEPTEKSIVADGTSLLRQVEALHSKVAIVGRSLGSGVAVQVASHSTTSHLLLITPYDSIVDIGERMYPFLPVRWLMRDTYESGKFAPGIRIPTTIIAAEYDQQIPRASTEKLLSRFDSGIATMTVIEGVGHNDLETNRSYREALEAALK